MSMSTSVSNFLRSDMRANGDVYKRATERTTALRILSAALMVLIAVS